MVNFLTHHAIYSDAYLIMSSRFSIHVIINQPSNHYVIRFPRYIPWSNIVSEFLGLLSTTSRYLHSHHITPHKFLWTTSPGSSIFNTLVNNIKPFMWLGLRVCVQWYTIRIQELDTWTLKGHITLFFIRYLIVDSIQYKWSNYLP